MAVRVTWGGWEPAPRTNGRTPLFEPLIGPSVWYLRFDQYRISPANGNRPPGLVRFVGSCSSPDPEAFPGGFQIGPLVVSLSSSEWPRSLCNLTASQIVLRFSLAEFSVNAFFRCGNLRIFSPFFTGKFRAAVDVEGRRILCTTLPCHPFNGVGNPSPNIGAYVFTCYFPRPSTKVILRVATCKLVSNTKSSAAVQTDSGCRKATGYDGRPPNP